MFGKFGSNQDHSFPALGLALLIAASLGYHFWPKPLKTFRPESARLSGTASEWKLPSRLWQDPLQEARESIARASNGHTQGLAATTAYDGEPILAVTVYGGYSQMEHETRLRARNAIGLALFHSGFVPDPEDSEYLRFRRLPPPASSSQRPGPLDRVLPFEYWNYEGSSQDRSPGRILVVWIGDDLLESSQPLASLRRILGAFLHGSPGSTPSDPFRNGKVRLIGPPSSTALQEIATEIQSSQSAPSGRDAVEWSKLSIHSPWATASSYFLLGGPVAKLPQNIFRTTRSDRLTVGALVRELEIRQLQPDGNRLMAVISEADTSYGRALPLTLAACLHFEKPHHSRCVGDEENHSFAQAVSALQLGAKPWPSSLLRYTYLRGLDGQGPRTSANSSSSSSSSSSARATPQDFERPDGASQLDYARRLADLIRRSPEARRLKSIAIFGTDIYDKLLLLQALRDRLPWVWFLTTDLDASYLHPSQSPWTRNLLIGSFFPLSPALRDAGAQASPPFRDCYGMSIHRAALEAIAGAGSAAAARQLAAVPSAEARVYEVGRSDFHRFSGRESASPEDAPGWSWPWILVCCLIVPALQYLLLGRLLLRLWIPLASAAALLAILISAGSRFEPFVWFEGISIWPSEMLRALTAVLSLIFLMHACSSLARNAAQTRRLIYHDTHTVTALPTPGSRRWWEDLLHFIREPWGEPREGFTIEIERIWHAYCVYDRRSYRFLRTGLLTALTLSVAVTGLLIENPPRPCRGSLPCAIDFAITVTAIALVMLLIFFVLDATISCCRWILALRDSRTTWPSPETAQPCLALMPVNAYPLLDDHSDATRTHGITAVWLEIEIAAQRTVVICRLILYPFFVIPLLVLAQFDFFDRWAWPVSLLFVFGLLMVCAVTAALVLRRCAESARISALAEVQRARIQSYTHRQSGRDEACDALLKSIQEETRGAFAPLIQNPVFAAVLLPISGLGTGLAIETMLKGL